MGASGVSEQWRGRGFREPTRTIEPSPYAANFYYFDVMKCFPGRAKIDFEDLLRLLSRHDDYRETF